MSCMLWGWSGGSRLFLTAWTLFFEEPRAGTISIPSTCVAEFDQQAANALLPSLFMFTTSLSSDPLTVLLTQEPLLCMSRCDCSSTTIALCLVATYVSLAIIMNLYACWRFVVAWNLIAELNYRRHLQRQRRRRRRGTEHTLPNDDDDDEITPRTRSNILYACLRSSTTTTTTTYSELPGLVHVNHMLSAKDGGCAAVTAPASSSLSCPICLADYFENELVTCCDEGCKQFFHQDCLFMWLERSDSCPCCRHDLLQRQDDARRSRGVGAPPNGSSWMTDLSAFLGYVR